MRDALRLERVERVLADPAVCSCGPVRISMRDHLDDCRIEDEPPVICERCGKPVPVIVLRLVACEAMR